MSAKTRYISNRTWRTLSADLRKDMCAVLGKAQCVGEYACCVVTALRACGEHDMADSLLAELDAQIDNEA